MLAGATTTRLEMQTVSDFKLKHCVYCRHEQYSNSLYCSKSTLRRWYYFNVHKCWASATSVPWCHQASTTTM
eukprot:14876-Heterococcus_DN1.PRE.1